MLTPSATGLDMKCSGMREHFDERSVDLHISESLDLPHVVSDITSQRFQPLIAGITSLL